MFALLHCAGKPLDKAKTLYCLLQKGGFEKQKWIAAKDRDLLPVFNKMCSFVTHDIFELAVIAGITS